TGNARFTPAHLHFGIYTGYGAIDPLVYVQKVKSPAEKNVSPKLNQWFKASTKVKLYPSPEKKNAFFPKEAVALRPQSHSKDFYRIILRDGTRAFVSENDVSDKMKL
ncbi:MAG: hypothetical protein H7X88_04205, partial [Gloeobacteraceae cyanobacterium ES-bin-316]|nr:hypothetical protein [Ferruginibacter sp.]